MAELTLAERTTIQAVVDGMQARTRRRRKAARQGWAMLLTGIISMPILASAFDGMITLPTALMRIGMAFVLTMLIIGMAGSLFDSYQADAAVRTVETAVQTARTKVDAGETAPPTTTPPTAEESSAADGSNDGVDDDQ